MATRRRRRRRGRRSPRRRTMIVVGVLLLMGTLLLASLSAVDRAGLLERWFGWMALRGFVTRAAEVLAMTPVLAGFMIVGLILIVAGSVSRR